MVTTARPRVSLLCLNGQHETCPGHRATVTTTDGTAPTSTCGCTDASHTAASDSPQHPLAPTEDRNLTVSDLLTPERIATLRAIRPELDDEMVAAGATPLEDLPDGATLVAKRDENRQKQKRFIADLLQVKVADGEPVLYEKWTTDVGKMAHEIRHRIDAAVADAIEPLQMPVEVDPDIPPGVIEFRAGGAVVGRQFAPDVKVSFVDERHVEVSLTAGEVRRITGAHLELRPVKILATVRDIIRERLETPEGRP